MIDKIPIITVLGPTATGKTKLSIELAKYFDGEIISADSMQIYKNMDIATASPTEEEKQGIAHHLMNFLDPGETFSVADYVRMAHDIINDIHKRGKAVILVGGTGLYIDSLLNNISFTETKADKELRDNLSRLYDEKGADHLLNMIKEFDEPSYKRLKDEINKKRIIRCIEIYKTTGITQTQQNINSKLTPSPYLSVKIGLKCDNRQFLYDRINLRVDKMLESGLLEEAERVLSDNPGDTAKMAIGYKELKPYFDNEADIDTCIEKLKMQTRRYAKRQLTWFTKDKTVKWYDIDILCFDEIFESSVKYIKDELYG